MKENIESMARTTTPSTDASPSVPTVERLELFEQIPVAIVSHNVVERHRVYSRLRLQTAIDIELTLIAKLIAEPY